MNDREHFPHEPGDIKGQLDEAIREVEMSYRIVQERLGPGATYLDTALVRLRSIKPSVDVVALRRFSDANELRRVARLFDEALHGLAQQFEEQP